MDLKTLTEINAPSGHEQAIRRFLLDELKKLGFAPVLDRMGNVVVVKEGTGDAPRKRVMVSAHMDEVGLIVTSATEDGYLRIAAAGGIDPRVLVSKRVTVGGGQAARRHRRCADSPAIRRRAQACAFDGRAAGGHWREEQGRSRVQSPDGDVHLLRYALCGIRRWLRVRQGIRRPRRLPVAAASAARRTAG